MRFSTFLHFLLLFLLLVALSTFQISAVQAATITVTSSNDSGTGSLRQSIASAVSGDTIRIVFAGPITLTSGQITINKNLTIEATSPNFSISGNNASRIFNITSGVIVEIRGMTLRNGRETTGGAILNLGRLTITNSTLDSNSATSGVGGAISSNNASGLTIVNSTFTSNTSTGGGGAVHNTGPLNIIGSTFSGNTNTGVQAGAGGAVFNTSGAMDITNSTFLNNSSQGFGGGAFSASQPTTVESSTFLGNGGVGNIGIISVDAQTTISRSIIDNSACFVFGTGTLIDGGNNIGFNTIECVGTNVDPMLGPLGAYGGAAKTLRLLAGSPAVDAYTTGCPAVDQRGVARPQGSACDIGAYELSANTFTVTNLNDSGDGSLRSAVTSAVSGDTINISIVGTIPFTSGQMLIDKNLIINGTGQNSTTFNGGGNTRIFQIATGVIVEIHDAAITQGFTGSAGGGILNSGTLILNNSRFSSSTAASGGAIFNESMGSLTSNNVTFSSNSATNANMGGGAIYNNGGTVIINSSTFSGNQTPGSGGAISNGGTLTLNTSTVSGNTATKFGGGILNIAGTLTINASTISGNVATTNDGGGIYSSDVLNMTNSTVTGNQAGSNGGGLYSANSNIDSSTIVNNTAAAGANIHVPANTTTISRSIVSVGSCSVAVGASLTDGSNNIAFNASGCPGANVDPLLGTLGAYGGSTQTMRISLGSPAIDAYSSNCLSTDQRGNIRPRGAACDIGAYEANPVLTVTNLNDSGLGSLRDTVSDAVAGDTIVFNIGGTVTLTSGEIVINKSLIIDGLGHSVTISGNNASRIFSVNNAPSNVSIVEFRNLTLLNGNAGFATGGAIFNTGNLTITNTTLTNNNTTNMSASTLGGAIFNSGTLTINSSNLNGNTAAYGGAIYNNSGTLSINNSSINGNTVTGNGGAIFNNSGTIYLSNSSVLNNTSNMNGGGIFNGNILNVTNSTFYNNSATMAGGALYIFNQATISSSTFVSNSAMSGAGNIHNNFNTSIRTSILNGGSCSGTITDTGNNIAFNASGCPGTNVNPLLGTLGNNGGVTQTIPLLEGSPAIDAYSTNCPATDQRGITRPQGSACDIGAYEVQPPASLIVTNLNDSGVGSLRGTINSALPGDTIVFGVSGTVTLTTGQILIDKNLVIDGSGQNITINGNNDRGVVQVNAGVTAELRNLSITGGNDGPNLGGGVSNFGTLTIANVMIFGNVANGGGGVFNSGNLTIMNSTITGNTIFPFIGSGEGGGILNGSGGTMTINNSTIANNTNNTGNGGGVANGNGSTLIITNSTIANNSASGNGGAVYNGNGTMFTISSATISGNTAGGSGSGLYNNTVGSLNSSATIYHNNTCTGTITDGGNNIAFNASGCPGANVNPLLGTLGNNGGITQTIPLLVGSPAIDAYSIGCLATDQRGTTRPQGTACDIGAYEYVEVPPTPTPTTTSITENEFYAAVEAASASYPDITNIIIDFVPNMLNLTVATQEGVVGNVSIAVTQEQDFAAFSITSITVNGGTPPDSYITIINRDLPAILTSALDALVIERFGDLVDVQSITVSNSTLTLSLN